MKPGHLFAALLVVFLAVCGPLLKNLNGMVGIPNWVPLIRDPLILAVAAYGIAQARLFSQPGWRWLLMWLLLFMVSYVGVSIYQDRAIVGLYYLRSYLLPVLFCIGLIGQLTTREEPELATRLLRLLLIWNALLFAIAIVLYVLLLELPRLRPGLFGAEVLPTAWYISGGAWMRMGLPTASPNGLGLVFALHALLFVLILLCRTQRKSGPGNGQLAFHLGIALVGLVLTFSRSSMLLFILGCLAILMIPGVMSFERVLKLAGWVLLGLALLVAFGYAFDVYSDGYVSRWLELNLQGRDPSAIGHLRSVQDAVDRWSEYLMFGYTRGTVGPKAILFTGNINNVESSWLGVLYDMGLFNSLPYVSSLVAMFSLGYRHPGQWAMLIGLAGPFAMLPYVFETEVVLYSFFVYLLAGYLLRNLEPAPLTGHACRPVLAQTHWAH